MTLPIGRLSDLCQVKEKAYYQPIITGCIRMTGFCVRDWYAENGAKERSAAWNTWANILTPRSQHVENYSGHVPGFGYFSRLCVPSETWMKTCGCLSRKFEICRNFGFCKGSIVGKQYPAKVCLSGEFRGFALADKCCAPDFINAQDSIAARIFTLAHDTCTLMDWNQPASPTRT